MGAESPEFLMEKVLRFWGGSIDTLHFLEDAMSERVCHQILKHCTSNVKHIKWVLATTDEGEFEEWTGNFRNLIHKFGEGLQSLKVSCSEEFAVSLPRGKYDDMLIAALKKCVNLKSLDMSIILSRDEEDLWKCVGSNLEHFSVNIDHEDKDGFKNTLRLIRLHCPCVTSFETGFICDEEEFFKLILSYGAQLERAPIFFLWHRKTGENRRILSEST